MREPGVIPSHDSVYVALGTNVLPDRPLKRSVAALRILQKAADALRAAGWPVLSGSYVWRSRAWPDPNDPAFYNACVALRSGGRSAQALMADLLKIEQDFGRRRTARNAPRPLDLDIVDFEGRLARLSAANDRPAVDLPHPRVAGRSFVLGPLLDVAPNWRHPSTGETGETLFEAAQIAWPSRRLKSRLS